MSDPRIGLIARADDRGLGTLTTEFHRHVRPDKTLIVLTGNPDFPEHPDRFRHGTIYSAKLGHDLSLDEHRVREFLADTDVVYTAETFYDWRILDWAREMSVVTVCHGMPELTVQARKRSMAHPDQWWWPTEWMLDRMPLGRLMPIPSTYKGGLRGALPHDTGPLRVVHPGGKEALADRDGTQTFLDALSYVTEDVEATVFVQDRHIESWGLPDNVKLSARGAVESRWEMYQDQHLMVLPRRYGGLSLKVHESLESGVPVILPDLEPNRRWPGPRTPSTRGKRILVPCGPLRTFNADPRAIAAEIDTLARDRSLLEVEQRQAIAWAEQNSWSALRPDYMRAFRDLL